MHLPETTLECFEGELEPNAELNDSRKTLKKGVEYYFYLSSSTLVETDWRHDNQIAVGKQLMKFSNILIEGEWIWNESDQQNRIVEIRKVQTQSGGEYTRQGEEHNEYVFMEIGNSVVEPTDIQLQDFEGIEPPPHHLNLRGYQVKKC